VTGRTLITGADGYLGRLIAARLLAETDDRLVLTVRAADQAELDTKRAALACDLAAPGDLDAPGGRVDIVAADLRTGDPFAALDPAAVTGIVHVAALTAFNVERAPAREVNVEGTARLVDFARRCPKLERLLALSTLFSAGRRVGSVEEAPLGGAPGYVNHYEWSKAEGESHLLGAGADLPVSIARLATIVADDDSGAVTQQNAFHNTLKLFFYGLLSLMPGERATPLYLATADFTSRGVARLLRPEVPGGVYHLAPAPSETATAGDLIDLAFDVFELDPGFRRRRLLRPRFCDIESFRDLVGAARALSNSPMRQALESVAPFAEQMFLPKEFQNGRLREAWPGYAVPPPRLLAEATCRELVRTRWGRNGSDLEETA
jgi:nucleoside-diphosphate-sugar epimerase